jgi:hypothetical protein
MLAGCSEPQTPPSSHFPNSGNGEGNGTSQNSQDPQMQAESEFSNLPDSEGGELSSNSQASSPQEPLDPKQRNIEFFNGLNSKFRVDYCGIWQLYKRKPHNEPERLITENQYLDLKSDYTYDANGWTISGTGQWLPTFNYGNTGEQMAYLLFTNTKYERAQLTTVRVELTEQNSAEMLKISELEKNTYEYYIRKQ